MSTSGRDLRLFFLRWWKSLCEWTNLLCADWHKHRYILYIYIYIHVLDVYSSFRWRYKGCGSCGSDLPFWWETVDEFHVIYNPSSLCHTLSIPSRGRDFLLLVLLAKRVRVDWKIGPGIAGWRKNTISLVATIRGFCISHQSFFSQISLGSRAVDGSLASSKDSWHFKWRWWCPQLSPQVCDGTM